MFQILQSLSLIIEAPRNKTSASSVESLRGMRSLLQFSKYSFSDFPNIACAQGKQNITRG